MVTPEVVPFVKVGGLADVVGALPGALRAHGHDVRICCPLYGSVHRAGRWVEHERPLNVYLGGEVAFAKVWEAYLPDGPPVYFLEYDRFFARNGVYDGPWGPHDDNDLRFAFLSRAALDLCNWLNWTPHVVHAHDWAAALAPVMLNRCFAGKPLEATASVLTIHNLDHQGYADRRVIDYAGLPGDVFSADNLEAMGAVNLLKGGIYHATKVTTVSPHYVREIQEPAGGAGLDPVLRFRSADLLGVLNGIDTRVWNPATDALIPANFDANDLHGKRVCKGKLQEALGLNSDPRVPIFAVVSRLYHQKGIDLLSALVPSLMETMEVQLAVLGTGDEGIEAAMRYYRERFAGRVGASLEFNERLAHLLYAGSDFFLMPSRFEPCGLGQLYAMRYGTPPVVRATGGLVDTVEPYNERAGTGTGFLFEEPSEHGLYYAMGWACATYYDRPDHYRNLQQSGMRQDFSWDGPAMAYENIYRWAADLRQKAFRRASQAPFEGGN